MTYAPFDLYLVALDWLLVCLYVFVLVVAGLSVLAAVLIEYDLRAARAQPEKQTEPLLARLGDALPQVGNVVLFRGNQNHSISGDAWRYGLPRVMALANWLFRNPLHCKKAHWGDINKARVMLAETQSVKE